MDYGWIGIPPTQGVRNHHQMMSTWVDGRGHKMGLDSHLYKINEFVNVCHDLMKIVRIETLSF